MAVQRLSNSGRNGYSYKSLIAGITPIPSVPTVGTATALTYESATVEFTAPGDYSGSTYTATSSPGGFTGTSATSPIVVTGLSELTTYTFTVTATNATGTSGASAASNSITTPQAYTPSSSYDALATYTVPSGGVTSVNFSVVGLSGYTHLQIRGVARGSNNTNYDSLQLRFNGDSSANYSGHLMGFGDGSTNPPPSYNYANITSSYNAGWITGNTASANNFGYFIIDIVEYANTNKFKTVKSINGADNNGGGTYVSFSSGNWRSTNAITSIDIYSAYGSTIQQNSQFALYGIKG